ncbi:MAG TPA: alkaline phosphatase family protein, partial [Gemmatimonadales bacterium]|nr:alkaline phosphatase family protein [Gemmatimonadales bacterium]
MHRHSRKRLIPLACTLSSLWLIACQREQSTAPVQTPLAERRGADEGNGRIPGRLQHLVVIYLENRSFDNLYGEFAGADGLSNAAATSTQVDATGTAFATLPQVSGSPFPATLPNAPFPIEDYVAANLRIRDLVHRFYQEQQQIDGGKMDKFAAFS